MPPGPVFASKFLSIVILTIENFEKLGNNSSSLFNVKKYMAAKAAATRAAKIAFFIVFYGF